MEMKQSDRPKHDYSTLPEDILTNISKRLHSIDDTLRFRAVCDMFRSLVSTPLTNLIPKSARRSSFRLGPLNNRRTQQQIRRIQKPASHFLLTESTVYAVEPRHPIYNPLETTQTWMIRIEHTNSGEVRLKDPLCGYRFQSLYNKLPKCFNLLDHQIKEITKAYQLEPARKSKGTSRLFYKGSFKKRPTFFVKVVASTATAPDDQFSVMAIHRSSKLFAWKIGDKSLTDIFLGHDSYEDIIYHNRKFYALDYMGKTLSVDSRSFEVVRVTYMDSIIPAGRHHLVKSCEDLFLIFRRWAYEDSRIYFEAFKLDEERNQWVPVVHELEDRALFVGEDCSFAVSAKEFRGCKGNCIYFKSNSFSKGVNEDYPGASAGIFNFKDNTVGRLAVFPGYSEIFWPLPSWLNFHAASTSTHAPH